MPYIDRFPDGTIQSVNSAQQHAEQEYLKNDSPEYQAHQLVERKREAKVLVNTVQRNRAIEAMYATSAEKSAADTACANIDAATSEAEIEAEIDKTREE